MAKLKKWEKVTDEELKGIKVVCFDIDDTVTTDGKLTQKAYEAMWNLKNAGYYLVPITGRPASWCDHFARFWPIDAVIGENGAFTFFMQDGARKRIDTLGDDSLSALQRINKFRDEILSEFPDAKWASDQEYREYDIAVDFCEDVERWTDSKIASFVEFCKKNGAKAKISSIHINTWFGNYDKCSGIKYWIDSGHPGITEKVLFNEMIFIGDSLNDEPMFAEFPRSVGVANINAFLKDMKSPPTWVTEGRSGDGFVQFATKLIDNKC